MQTKQNTTGLVWFGNDLRIKDSSVLSQAIEQNNRVIGIYCLNPSLLKKSNFGFSKLGLYRAKFLLESLQDLKQNLSKLNISLLVYYATPQEIIPKVCKRFGINTLYKQKEWTLEEVQEKLQVEILLKEVSVVEIYNQFLYHPKDLLSNPQKIPDVFTSFRKKLENYVDVRKEVKLAKTFSSDNLVENPTSIPTLLDLGFNKIELDSRTAFPFKGGESNALQRLNDYFFNTKRLGFYKKTRNGLVGKDYSSKLSAWLSNGCISARTVYWQVKKFEEKHYKNQSTYWLVFELIWRDYFKYISMKYGNSIFRLGGILDRDYKWKRDLKQIENWIQGKTSDSFVNSNMIELKKTGWMSNRGRQNVASYFAKELELDWRIGAAYFEELLLDYDVHSNYGNWMYVSGVGNDPRNRKFNTKIQAERYDSEGKYRKLWLQPPLF